MIHVVGKYIIQVPQDHALPNIQANNPLYDKGIIPALSYIQDDNPGGVIIDIGANVGDPAALLSTCGSNPILCIEGSKTFLPFLKKNATLIDSDVKIIEKFVRSSLHDKSYTLVEKKGTASLLKVEDENNTISNDDDMISVLELITVAGKNISLFKTDTDGFDIGIVSDFIILNQDIGAVIFMEYDLSFLSSDKEAAKLLFEKAQDENYSVAVFTNRGLPLFFAESVSADLLLDIGQFCILQKSFNVNLEYLDLFLLPRNKINLWTKISKGYRSRHVL